MGSTAASSTVASSSRAAVIPSSSTAASVGTISATQLQQATIAALGQFGLSSEDASSVLRHHFAQQQQATFGTAGLTRTPKNMQSVIWTAARKAVASRGCTDEQAAALIGRHLSQRAGFQAASTDNEGEDDSSSNGDEGEEEEEDEQEE